MKFLMKKADLFKVFEEFMTRWPGSIPKGDGQVELDFKPNPLSDLIPDNRTAGDVVRAHIAQQMAFERGYDQGYQEGYYNGGKPERSHPMRPPCRAHTTPFVNIKGEIYKRVGCPNQLCSC